MPLLGTRGGSSSRGFGLAVNKVPNAPTIGTATEGSGTAASVTFTAPSNNGGSRITSYTITSSPGNLTGTGSSSPITVSGLSYSTAYTFTVKATNVVGSSVASAASNSLTINPPATTPDAPLADGTGSFSPGGTITWIWYSAPYDGGSPITGYRLTNNNTGQTWYAGPEAISFSVPYPGPGVCFGLYASNALGESGSYSFYCT